MTRAAGRIGIALGVLVAVVAAPSRAQVGASRAIATHVGATAGAPVTPARTPVIDQPISFAAGSLIGLGAGIGMHFLPSEPQDAHATVRWRGGILADEPFRDAFRLRSMDDQEVARTISDVTLVATMVLAQGIDATLVPIVQGDHDLAWQASLAHALALGLTLSVGEIVKRTAGRARPYERDCASDPGRAGCRDSDTFHSFYSLHGGVAFTSAGVSCALHLSRSLYGDVPADATSCAGSLALATTTGLLRVLSDRHYLSDVLIGAALGFLVGYLVPLAVVPERRSDPGAPGALPIVVAPMVSPGPSGEAMGTVGASVSGAF